MKRIVFIAVVLSVRALFAQATLNMSRDLIRLGIAASNMTPDHPDLDAGPLFTHAVAYAQNHQFNRVIADPGSYFFRSVGPGNAQVLLSQITNLSIDLQGSDLYFGQPFQNGIAVSGGTNLVLENFTADYDPLPFTQVRVVSVDASQRTIHFAVDHGWQNPTALNAVFAAVPDVGSVEIHVFRNGHPISAVPRMYAVNPLGTDQFTIATDPGGFTTSALIGLIRPGDTVFLGMRTGQAGALRVNFCTGCTFRNIQVYSSVEYGIGGTGSQSSLFEHTYSLPRPGTDRLASTYGQLEMAVGPGNQYRLNRMIRVMDNAIILIGAALGTVSSQSDSRTYVVEGSPGTTLSVGSPVPNGSAVAFQRPSDGAILATAVVVSQVAPPFPGPNPYYATYTFDRDLPSSLVGTIMYGTAGQLRGGNTVVERNAFEEGTDCCRALLFGGLADSAIRGNYIQESPMAAIQIENNMTPGGQPWPPGSNLSISNNVIDNANWTATAFSVYQLGSIEVDSVQANFAMLKATSHQNFSLTGNFIVDSGGPAVWLGNTDGATVSENYFLNSSVNPAVQTAVASRGVYPQPLVIQASQNVTASNNTVDQTSGRVWVTDTQYRELAAYAPGSVFRLNAYGLGALSSPTISITDADGASAAVSVQSTAAHSIDVQIPASTALGAAYLTVRSGDSKYFGTLFLDSVDNVPALNGCTYELSPSSTLIPASGIVSILVVTQAGCAYSVSASDPSATVSGAGAGASTATVKTTRGTTVEVAGLPILLRTAPTIQAIQDVWNYTSGIAPGAWVVISGTELSVGPPQLLKYVGTNQLPTIANGTSVTFNGTPAALLYVSPTQVNVLVPAGIAPGPVQVIVQSSGLSSLPLTITATATLPAIYAVPNADGSSFFVTAAFEATAYLVGNKVVDSRVARAAWPGDIVDLYAIGMGATQDSSKFITDHNFLGAYPVSAPVTANIGGEKTTVYFAGLITPGLYLVRVAVPGDLAPGPQPIELATPTGRTSSTLMLMVSPTPPNLIQNGSFESPLTGAWNFSVDSSRSASATIQEVTSTAADGTNSAQIDAGSAPAGTSNATAIQLWQAGFPIQKGQVYTLQFWAKAENPGTIGFDVVQNGGSMINYGLVRSYPLRTGWIHYFTYFQATATDAAARLDFNLGDHAGNMWIDGVVLR